MSEWQLTNFLEPGPPHAHPAGPPDYKAHFDEFLKRFQSYKAGPPHRQTSGSKPQKKASEDSDAYQEFWHAPTRLWNSRIRTISEEEIECVLVRIMSLC